MNYIDILFLALFVFSLWQSRHGISVVALHLLTTILIFLGTARISPAITEFFVEDVREASLLLYISIHLGTAMALFGLIFFFVNPLDSSLKRMSLDWTSRVMAIPLSLVHFVTSALLLLVILGSQGQKVLGVPSSASLALLDPMARFVANILFNYAGIDIPSLYVDPQSDIPAG